MNNRLIAFVAELTKNYCDVEFGDKVLLEYEGKAPHWAYDMRYKGFVEALKARRIGTLSILVWANKALPELQDETPLEAWRGNKQEQVLGLINHLL